MISWLDIAEQKVCRAIPLRTIFYSTYLVSIQNITFGGITGFTKRPSSAWFGDDHQFAGIVHQERNVTFVLFDKAGHLVPQWQPSRVSGTLCP